MNPLNSRGKLFSCPLGDHHFAVFVLRGLGAGKPEGAIAWYHLNGNAQDSLSDQSGTLVGAAGYGLGISGEGVRVEGEAMCNWVGIGGWTGRSSPRGVGEEEKSGCGWGSSGWRWRHLWRVGWRLQPSDGAGWDPVHESCWHRICVWNRSNRGYRLASHSSCKRGNQGKVLY